MYLCNKNIFPAKTSTTLYTGTTCIAMALITSQVLWVINRRTKLASGHRWLQHSVLLLCCTAALEFRPTTDNFHHGTINELEWKSRRVRYQADISTTPTSHVTPRYSIAFGFCPIPWNLSLLIASIF